MMDSLYAHAPSDRRPARGRQPLPPAFPAFSRYASSAGCDFPDVEQEDGIEALDNAPKKRLLERVEELEKYASDFFGRLRQDLCQQTGYQNRIPTQTPKPSMINFCLTPGPHPRE
jgi:hypothetical protein